VISGEEDSPRSRRLWKQPLTYRAAPDQPDFIML